jgi:predicted dehydrogenase
MARFHLMEILKQADTTKIEVVCDPSPEAYKQTQKIFRQAGMQPPVNQPDYAKLLDQYSDQLDAVFIITPHVDHHDQTAAALKAGLDVLLEKPMVMNPQEAQSLIETHDDSGRVLTIAFQGSLSPQIRHAVSLSQSGKLGQLQSINALVWQNWGQFTEGTWRQNLAESGGGFLFDTGAHMLNTVVDLAGEGFIEVSAWLENNGRPVDTRAVINGRLASGALVSLHASGETIPSCASDIYAFYTKAILRTGIWGERLEIQFTGESDFSDITVPSSMGVWEQFLAVLNGKIPNPSPPEVGLRMANLYEAIKISAEDGGKPFTIA